MEIYTKEDFKQIFIDLGIEKGSKILLEADLSRYSGLVGNYQMLIETLQELIGDTGLLCMPCFSYSCLDPACTDMIYPFEKWKEVFNERKCAYRIPCEKGIICIFCRI